MSQTNTATRQILYVEDDSDDRIFLTESFSFEDANLVCAADGQEAITYLHSIETSALPSLIILDLNMPRWDGRQTLNYLKSHPQLSSIPVVILSTSENKVDKLVCSRLGAASYFEKPYHLEGYKEVVRNCIPLLKS